MTCGYGVEVSSFASFTVPSRTPSYRWHGRKTPSWGYRVAVVPSSNVPKRRSFSTALLLLGLQTISEMGWASSSMRTGEGTRGAGWQTAAAAREDWLSPMERQDEVALLPWRCYNPRTHHPTRGATVGGFHLVACIALDLLRCSCSVGASVEHKYSAQDKRIPREG